MLHVVRQLQKRFPGSPWASTPRWVAASALVLLLGLALRALG